jgi:RNA polymerase sigma-70 factor (ECF subfamily)
MNLAEELTQETFYKAYKSIDNFEGNCKLSVWLCQIAKNFFYSYCMKEKVKNYGVFDENIISDINIQEDFIQTDDVITLHKIFIILKNHIRKFLLCGYLANCHIRRFVKSLVKVSRGQELLITEPKRRLRLYLTKRRT